MEDGYGSLDRWAHDWQAGRWLVSELPTVLEARKLLVPGDLTMLGAAITLSPGDRRIILNEAIDDLPIGRAVLAHEAAHLLLGGQSIGLCQVQPRYPKAELAAWLAAARLTVSDHMLRGWRDGAVDSEEIASLTGVPSKLVRLHLHQSTARRPDEQHSLRSVINDFLSYMERTMQTYRRFVTDC